jgi:hypothetical protein
MTRLRRLRWLVVAVLLPLGPAGAQDPAAELTRAVGSLGLPGLLWGRLAVEEESPEGPWTPLAGVSVALFPYAPSVAAELERIRDAARESGPAHDAAVGRLLDRLKAYEVQAAALTRPEHPLVRRATTDPAGLFVFDDLPSGEWLVVAVQTSPYSPRQASRPPAATGGRRSSRSPDTFLPQVSTPAKEAEVWVSRVRVTSGERTRVLLTDRARFMVGPVR